MRFWFTSDTHYFHTNVISYCHRPFNNVDDMNESLIAGYNSLVAPDDDVWFLGDIIFGGTAKAQSILSRLNGTKRLVAGNHDWKNKAEKWLKLGFDSVHKSAVFDGFNLSHFPYRGLEHDERFFDEQLEDDGKWLLHGHVHNAWRVKGRMINVGVDVWGYLPVSLETLKEIAAGGPR